MTYRMDLKKLVLTSQYESSAGDPAHVKLVREVISCAFSHLKGRKNTSL